MPYAAVSVALLALAFTIGSFWWLHARTGPLRTYRPDGFAASIGGRYSTLRIPLVLHNTGAAATVVLGLRLRFVDTGEVLDWEGICPALEPKPGEARDFSQPVAVAGRSTRELVAAFNGTLPGVVPEGRPYDIAVEGRTGRKGWHSIATFDLRLENLLHPGRYIVFSNVAGYHDADQLREGVEARKFHREQLGLQPMAEDG